MAATGYPWSQDWDADALRDIVRDYVIEHLADDDAVLVIDETGFLKQGNASCGVAGNTPVRQARYELPRSASSRPTFPSWPCVHRSPRCIFQRNGPTIQIVASHIRACGTGLCDQTKACDENDRTRDSRGVPSQVGSCRYGLRVGDIEQQLRQAAKAMCSGSAALMCSDPGASGDQVSAPPRTSLSTRRPFRLETPVRRGPEPKDRAA